MPDIVRVTELAIAARRFLYSKWPLWRVANNIAPVAPRPMSTGMCRFSTCFMLRLLKREMPGGDWVPVGGCRDPFRDVDPDVGLPGGFRRGRTRGWHGHYWLIERRSGLIVDVTADQFGEACVFVGWDRTEGRIRPRYKANYRMDAVPRHLRPDMKVAEVWFAEWLALGASVAPVEPVDVTREERIPEAA